MASWLDDYARGRGAIGGEAREALEQLQEEQNLPDVQQWQAYDIYMDADGHAVTALITDRSGAEYEISVNGIDMLDIDSWDWVFDIWDWLIETNPSVDRDSHYDAAP